MSTKSTLHIHLRLAALALFAAGCSETSADRPPNVILVCIDTLRADHLGCYGYDARPTSPAMDALAEDSIVYRAASAAACWTKPSVPSYMTGTYPAQHGVYRGSARDADDTLSDVLPEESLTLAEVFQERGYSTAAFVKNAQLRVGMGLEQGFDVYKDSAGDAREIRWRANDWLDARDRERPFFLYLHVLDVHWPYPVPAEYATTFADEQAVATFRDSDWRELRDAINDGERVLEPAEREQLIALYDGAIRFVDDQIALLRAKLEREGLAEDTVICIVSDHGEEFGEHGRIGHGHGLWEGLLHVPWILHVPGRAGRQVGAPCSLVDLFPTLLAAAGIPAGDGCEGVDRLANPDAGVLVFAEHLEPGSYQQSWRVADHKAWHRLERLDAPRDGADGADVRSSLATLAAGGRWEARVAVHEGSLRARRLRPAATQDADKEAEVKGVVRAIDGERLDVAGVPVRAAPDVERYGALVGPDGAARDVEVGHVVKVRGALDAEGRFVAQKIKLYAEDEDPEEEVRGTLEEVDGRRVRIAGLWLTCDDDVDLELEREDDGPRLDRNAALTFLDALAAADADVPFTQSVRHFDLAADPRELAPLATSEHPLPAGSRAAFLRRLLDRRVWTSGNERILTESELGDLRAIGYAD